MSATGDYAIWLAENALADTPGAQAAYVGDTQATLVFELAPYQRLLAAEAEAAQYAAETAAESARDYARDHS